MRPLAHLLILAAMLLIVPAACAAILRAVNAPGSAILGGLVAGVLLGPTIFGRILPVQFETLLVGGVTERQHLEELRRRQAADIIAAEHARFDAEGMRRMAVEHRAARAPLEERLELARWRHQRPLRGLTMVIIIAAMLGAGTPRAAVDRDGGAVNWPSAIHIAAWSAALPGGIAFVAARAWFGWGAAEAALFAAALVVGPWALTITDRDAAASAEFGGERLIEAAGRIASVVAIALAAWAMWSVQGATGLMWAAVMLALPAGWLLSRRLPTCAERSDAAKPHAGVVQGVMVPALAATLAIKIELFHHFALWPIAIALLLSGDGRWLGAFLGAALPGGRRMLRAMRLVLGSSACAPTQTAIAALAVHTGTVSPSVAYALMLGAVLTETTVPLRRRFAARLAEAEAELDRFRNEHEH
jgi:hypothetical protein